MKRIYPIVVILAAVSLLLPQAAGARETIKVALALSRDVAGTDFINGMYELFKREVEARTNGALTVEIIYGGALGDPVSRLDQMRKNVIQMSDASDGNYATLYPDIQVLNIPYLFATERSAWKVLDGRFGRELAEDLRTRTGIRVLGWWESGGFKHFSSSRPLRSPADFAGRNMRALGPLTMPLIAALKGSAIPIGFGDLYTALATGMRVKASGINVVRARLATGEIKMQSTFGDENSLSRLAARRHRRSAPARSKPRCLWSDFFIPARRSLWPIGYRHSAKVWPKRAMSKVRTWRSNSAGRRGRMIGCQTGPPI
jgi:Bacterial extracellular solute-binding protein, family 7